MVSLNKEDVQNSLPFNKGEGGTEYIETNGLGGWASSSVAGCNTRRYHGLLIAETATGERMNLVNKLDETIIVNNQKFELSANDYGNVIAPQGYNFLTAFTKNIFPSWLYQVGDIQLKKTIAAINGENTTVIIYDIEKAAQPFQLELLPLLSVRGYHNLMHANNSVNKEFLFDDGILQTILYPGTPTIFIKVPNSQFTSEPNWFYNFNYSVEKARGLDFTEDLYTPGKFTIQLKQGDSIGIILSTINPAEKDAGALLLKEKTRRELLINGLSTNSILQTLTLAADQFIIQKQNAVDGSDKTVIAGYHWFTDWGRDTMISLPGLCLTTGRFDDAKKILSAFAQSISMGMLPNRFQDNGLPPEYNNVDGTLWFFIAAYKYHKSTGDKDYILQSILPALKGIIDWHFKGTRYNIHVADDGLLNAGQEGQQLTWMDAKVNGVVITPRMGKPVEVQALWYNALNIFAEFLGLNGQQNDASIVHISIDIVKKSFEQKFWVGANNYLYDVIDGPGGADASIRPNQLFAISLPFALVEGDAAKSIINIITQKLYTPVGLRSLSPDDPHYIGIYTGSPFQRDSAYHQGTVWSWLLGPYIDAIISIDNDKALAQTVIQDFKYHLQQAGIGTVSEIFDGDAPHNPKGCIAQAWGVAEILRVIKEYSLEEES